MIRYGWLKASTCNIIEMPRIIKKKQPQKCVDPKCLDCEVTSATAHPAESRAQDRDPSAQ